MTSGILGAVMRLAGDLISRIILAPQKLPVGIVAAAVGGVFALGIVLRRSE